MNLYFKFLSLILKRLISKNPQRIDAACVSAFRVGLMDLDLNLHMNNGRYLSVMDLGRFDLMLRAGVFYKMIQGGYLPIVKSESISFEKSLTLWQNYNLETQLKAWDEKFFYMTQNFEINGKLVAAAHVRVCFKKRGVRGITPVSELFEFIGADMASVKMTDLAQLHQSQDDLLISQARE